MSRERDLIEQTVVNCISIGGSDPAQLMFYGHIISSCKIVIDKTFEAPAGVSFQGRMYYLYINVDLFNKFTLQERKAILVHEALHIVCFHILRRKRSDPHLWNLACDIAINHPEFIKDLPKDAMTYEKFGFEPKKTAEYYYDKLRQKYPKHGSLSEFLEGLKQSNPGLYGQVVEKLKELAKEHSRWDKSNIGDQALAEQKTNELINNCLDKTRGNISSSIVELIKLNRTEKSDIWKYIRFQMSSKTLKKEFTLKRRNRRYPNISYYPGSRKKLTNDGLVFIDVSGSMGNNTIANLVSKLFSIAKKTGSSLKMIQVDTEIKKIEKFDPKKTNFERKGNGGTNLYPAFQYTSEHKIKYDYLIIITDGMCEDHWPETPKKPVYFLLPKGENLNLRTDNFNRCKVLHV
jgi:predicted metal-dependent peptidase